MDALDATHEGRAEAAVHDGLGLLLRVTGALPPAVASDWAALGFRVQAQATAQAPAKLALDHALGLPGSGLVFARRAIDVQADDAAPLLRADDGTPLALWRAQAQGRVGLWTLADAWRLALAGERARYATLWSDTLATLARARAARRRSSRARRASTSARCCAASRPAIASKPRKAPASPC